MKLTAIVSALLACACVAFSSPAAAADESQGGPTYWYACMVTQVAAFANRVHVLCASNPGLGSASYYFAVPTSNAGEAARLTTLGTAALVSGKPLGIEAKSVFIPVEENYASWGCAPNDCRRALSVALGN